MWAGKIDSVSQCSEIRIGHLGCVLFAGLPERARLAVTTAGSVFMIHPGVLRQERKARIFATSLDCVAWRVSRNFMNNSPYLPNTTY